MMIRRDTVGGQIVADLRRDILFGRIPAGEVISQEAMCQRFLTSRMPVRDALRQLSHEGFLERLPGNRLRVSKLDRSDLLDMFWIEAAVHALATKRATERNHGVAGAFDALRAMQVRMEECSERGDYVEASAVNRQFHKAINYLADSPKLISTLRNVSLGIQGEFIMQVPEWLSQSLAEHEAILEAMQKGDGDTAGELMFRHTELSAMKIANDLAGANIDSEKENDELWGILSALTTVFDGLGATALTTTTR